MTERPLWCQPSSILLLLAIVALAVFVPGCRSSKAMPSKPNIRIEGPAGTPVGYGVSYFDGDDVDANGTVKTIPESGVFTDDLATGHNGLLVEAIPNSSTSITLILLDGTKEVQRASAKGSDETARVMAGKIKLPSGVCSRQ